MSRFSVVGLTLKNSAGDLRRLKDEELVTDETTGRLHLEQMHSVIWKGPFLGRTSGAWTRGIRGGWRLI